MSINPLIATVVFYAIIVFDGGRTAWRHARAGKTQWAWGTALLALGIIVVNELVSRSGRWQSIFGWPPLFAPTLAAYCIWGDWTEIKRLGMPAGLATAGSSFFLSGALFTQSLLGIGVKFQPQALPLLGLIFAFVLGLMGWSLLQRHPVVRDHGYFRVAYGSFGLGLWLVVTTGVTILSIRWH